MKPITTPIKKYLDPFEGNEIRYWTRKWGITADQLHAAIMDTGSSEVSELEASLKSKGAIRPAIARIFNLFA